mgnify:FL=1
MDYKLIATKTVRDADDFTTDYCWYKDTETGDNFFILGDSDFYDADPFYADYETSDDEVAQEWFDNYGVEEEDSLDEDVATTTSGDVINGEMNIDGTEFVDENGEKHPVNDAGEVIVDEILDEAKELNEAPVITLRDDEINNPDSFDLKDAIHQRVEDEKAAKEAEEKAAEEAKRSSRVEELKADADSKIEQIRNAADPIEEAFELLVPSEGKAETVAGEMVRAMMRVLYRDYNDGDKFMAGYGLQTCGSSMCYLVEMMPDVWADYAQRAVDEADRYIDDDAAYTQLITDLSDSLVDYLCKHPELFYTLNNEDSRDHDMSYLEDNQPRYDFEVEGNDDTYELLQHDIITSSDLYNYVKEALEYDSLYRDVEVESPWGRDSNSITVSNLTYDAREALEDMVEHGHFWDELTSEHEDDLEKIQNGEYDTDDLDDSDEEE